VKETNENESVVRESSEKKAEVSSDESEAAIEEPKEEKPNGNGHKKRRLFRGIKRK